MKKYTFKVYPAGLSREVYRVIEMTGEKIHTEKRKTWYEVYGRGL